MVQEKQTGKILIITPFHRSRRGNSLTSERIQAGLIKQGFTIGIVSLEENNWLNKLHYDLATRKYALIHGFHAAHCGRVLEMVPELQELPLVLTMTGTDINYDLKKLENYSLIRTLQLVKRIVVFNADFKEVLVGINPEWENKVVIIPQGVMLETGNPKSRSEFGLTLDDFVFLLPSGLRPVKHIELAIDALEKLQEQYPEVRLIIIGTTIDPEYSRQIIKRIENLSWVTYLGEVPHEEMKNILLLGDVVINTSWAEGQPQGALEAMSLGKPAILTAVPGNLNIITPGQEGFYIKDVEELRTAAETLVRDSALRQIMGDRAQKLVETRFTTSQEINRYEELYCGILRGC
ncbi:MAG: glycosyltransferase [Syntrophomonadaceae bacterium]|nr:glycosyltransferase [Syntrophomonadaceae bacterium]MDD3889880.1 glycosyltransferase [Syntrophomonadaceae bacterium]MDD4548550.1 glycosyltransferase [Syntrophomonadaceae bacterium]